MTPLVNSFPRSDVIRLGTPYRAIQVEYSASTTTRADLLRSGTISIHREQASITVCQKCSHPKVSLGNSA